MTLQNNVTWKKFLSLVMACLLALPMTSFGTQTIQQTKRKTEPNPKLAPDLEVLLADDDEEQLQSLLGKTLAQVRQERRARASQRAKAEGEEAPQRERISGLLLPSSEVLPEEKQSFIVQLSSTSSDVMLQEKVMRLGGSIHHKHGNSGLVTVEAPRAVIRQLAADGNVTYVSPDRPIRSWGHLDRTAAASIVRTSVSAPGLYGAGIGIAVLDSGIDETHSLLYNTYRAGNAQSVVYSKDFTSESKVSDDYGHGTHVASMVTGSGSYSSGAYRGIASDANLINLRVLNSMGSGSASSVIAALDWCVANKTTYNIRVINLSLGAGAVDSYKNDPLCQAARRAVNAGIVVVASAGNRGKDFSGNKMYGTISSPGIDPSVITVGAVNTFGTDSRADDVVTTFSSRGPTRGYTTDVNGVKRYDNLIKPDLVAPGNKLLGACSTIAQRNSFSLFNLYPSLNPETATDSSKQLLTMSGTSMSAPVVAGAAALLIQVRPNLTPSLVKAILMYTAQPLAGANMFEQGAGELNVEGAVKLAKLVKTTLPTSVGTSLLSSSLPTPQSTVAGFTFKWGQGLITNYGFLTGSTLMTQWQKVYGTGTILADATVVANNNFTPVSGQLSSGVNLRSGAVKINSNGLVLSDGVVISDGILLGDGVILGDGTILADGTMASSSFLQVLAKGVVLGDFNPNGDNTAGMAYVPLN